MQDLRLLHYFIRRLTADPDLLTACGPCSFDSNGGWILDNFPSTRDLWNACVDKNLLPDDVISLNDNSENGTFLAKRYYMINRESIDAKIQARLQREEEEKKRKAEERRWVWLSFGNNDNNIKQSCMARFPLTPSPKLLS